MAAAHPAAISVHDVMGKVAAASTPHRERADALDAAARAVVHAGNVTALAQRTGFNRRDLYRWGSLAENASGERTRMPIDAVVPLTLASGRDDLVEYFCREVGGVFVRIPHTLDNVGGLLAHLALVSSEFADVQREASHALADGRTSVAEVRAVDAELEELVQQAHALRLALAGARDRKAVRH